MVWLLTPSGEYAFDCVFLVHVFVVFLCPAHQLKKHREIQKVLRGTVLAERC